MKIYNMGSLNIDYVYRVPHFVQPGETIPSYGREIFAGGKGLNQSIALARAGAQVIHGGMIGPDGAFLKELLEDSGVDTTHICTLQEASGHTGGCGRFLGPKLSNSKTASILHRTQTP